MKKGDMIVLPEGIYHRFTLDDVNYVKVTYLSMYTILPVHSMLQGDSEL